MFFLLLLMFGFFPDVVMYASKGFTTTTTLSKCGQREARPSSAAAVRQLKDSEQLPHSLLGHSYHQLTTVEPLWWCSSGPSDDTKITLVLGQLQPLSESGGSCAPPLFWSQCCTDSSKSVVVGC